ncbi:MAG: IclR family transcriptional regulator [Nitriliruptoraceae bacterium]
MTTGVVGSGGGAQLTAAGQRPVKSALRTLEILEFLATAQGPCTLAQIASELTIPKSSLHAILNTMVDKGWVQSDDTGHRFRLAARALQVGAAYVENDDVAALVGEALEGLVGSLDETVHLGRLDRTDIVYLAKRESSQALRMFSAVGRRLPAYSTALGKSLLAALPADRLSDHLPPRLEPLTKHTITDRRELEDELASIRSRGYALDDQENSEGICCVAVSLPILEPPQDAISCSIPIVRFDTELRERTLAHLEKAREQILATVLPAHGGDAQNR